MRWGAALTAGLCVVMAVVVPVSAAAVVPVSAAAPASAAITVSRDSYGVPHIQAADLQGLAYATGYTTATDRLFEMDVIRKLGQGRLAELIGPSMLPSDEYVRREFLLPAGIEAQYQALPPAEKSLYEAYAAGVNAAAVLTLANPATTPSLFAALGDVWEPWTPEDSVTVDMLFTTVNFGGDGGGGEVANGQLLGKLQGLFGPVAGLQAFNDIDPPTTPDAPTIVAPGEGPTAPPGYDVTGPSAAQQRVLSLPGLGRAAAAEANEAATVQGLLAAFHIPVPHAGSYAAALAGSRTASGGGMLLGSPESGLEAPPIFYEVAWDLPGVTQCQGFTVPGLGPAIGVGWCNQHAWTVVDGNMGDQADLYVERLDPRDPHRYWFDGGWRDTIQRSTTYVVKSPVGCGVAGSPVGPCVPQVITQTYDYTVHGAISQVDSADHVGLAYRRAQVPVFLRSLLSAMGWDLSTSMGQFMDGTDAFTATYNLVYADAQGNIAYRFTGLQPIRPGQDRRFVMPGTGEAEWQGYLDACQLPSVTNPASGTIAVNQGNESKPISWWPNASNVSTGVVSRVARDQQLLAPLTHATMADLQAVNRSYIERADPYEAIFYPLFVHALRASTDPHMQAALSELEAWQASGFSRTDANGDGLEDHPGLAIFELDAINYAPPTAGFAAPLASALVSAAFGPTLGSTPLGGTPMSQLSAAEEALTGHTAHRWVTDPDAVIRSAVASVLKSLTAKYGTADVTRWHQPFPTEPFTAIGPVGPAPVKGMDHGSYSQIVDPRAGVGENVEPPGNVAADSAVEVAQIEAGTPPPHYEDQRVLYQDYGFKPMQLGPIRPESVVQLDDGGKFGSTTSLDFEAGRDPCRSSGATVAAPVGVLPRTGGDGGRAGAVVLILALIVVIGRRRRRAQGDGLREPEARAR